MKLGLIYGLGFLITTLLIPQKQNVQDMDFKEKRFKMVAEQIQSRGVNHSKIIKAMQNVERHLFVPRYLQKYAYQDRPLPIGHGQTISQPYIVGLMSQLLEVEEGEKLLEIGTGSGYQAAVLGELGGKVFSIEIVKPLQRRADFVLDSLGYENVETRYGDGYLGWPEQAPFDGIIVTCSPTKVPQALVDQLAEGGKLVIPVGLKNVKKLVLMEKKKGKIVQRNVIPVRFVPMVDSKGNAY
ncbi:protein-L-isoaspartate(D-aspartate) O-methyltransferase [Marinifilum caeruleilacunae]|uniref:Protein-L-isoaspartate O-methyltransferase n=1 Tax=Marinifilum caeruleilacunae TaxID=2499076 RepID=A0ABX1WR96_9BACT|nr:protein-L-isoaspartate(D-aspartate) O-methyltransferase [Marinifilum caeruleilacunae]NOU58605.1 protein-L-isoaspartate(D-aspartate) O-methyltransferase [Marinifilum caeruleilacunae]